MADQVQKRVSFEGGLGSTLAGILHRPAAPRFETGVVLAHSFTSSKNLKIISRLAKFLASRGFIVLRFDFMGLGDSRGRFEQATVGSHIQDLKAAVRFLGEAGHPHCFLAGHSLGGAVALLAARDLPQVRGVVAMAAPSEVTRLKRHLPEPLQQEIRTRGVASVPLAGRPIRIGRDLLEDLPRHDVLQATSSLRRPFLAVHGLEDDILPIESSELLFGAAHHPKSFFALPGADHLFSGAGQSERVSSIVCAWLETLEEPSE